jgi:ABC-2 type transport system permease protein
VRRYWKVYRAFFTSSLAREFEFKANLLAKFGQNLMWIFFFVMILFVVYGKTNSIAGWGRGHAFVLAASVFLMNAVFNAFFFSLQEIPQQIRMGTMDFVVTKPMDTQFWVSTRKFNFDQIGTTFAGIVMIIAGLRVAEVTPSLLQWLGFLILVATSTAIFYAFNLTLMTSAIWLVRVDNLWVLGESLVGVARYPIDIYGAGLRRFLTFVVPLAFLATVPARQLVQGFDGIAVLEGVAWAAVVLTVSRAFWRYAMRSYSSASS